MTHRSGDVPPARTGLPGPIERGLIRHYSHTAGGRVATVAALRAISVLVRRHPMAAAEMVGAGLWQGVRATGSELARKFRAKPRNKSYGKPLPKRLSNREKRKLRQYLAAAAKAEGAAAAPP